MLTVGHGGHVAIAQAQQSAQPILMSVESIVYFIYYGLSGPVDHHAAI